MQHRILYDARPLQPQTRTWGPGVFLRNILAYSSSTNQFVGRAQHFSDAHALDISTWPKIPKTNKLFFEFSLLGAPDFDLYWGTNHCLPMLSLGKPMVVTVHDLLSVKYSKDQSHSRYYARKLGTSVRRANKVVTISKTTANELISLYPEIKKKVTVGLLGYETLMPSEEHVRFIRSKFNYPYAVILGGHRPRKNLPVAIEAVAQLNRMGISLKLLITGDIHGSFKPTIERHSDVVQCVGMLQREQLMALLKNAQVMLSPSLNEGFGLPLLEAMAMECPTVIMDTPIYREVGGNAALFATKEGESWVNHLVALRQEPALRSEIIALGRENIERFSWKETAKIYNQVFEDALK